MKQEPINLSEKLASFNEQWAPKIIARMNDYHFKLVKLRGEFVWHSHDDTDETFIVLDGRLTIQFRDGAVDVAAGEMLVVPRGTQHRSLCEHECHVLLVEPAGTINTGDAGGSMTAPDDVWI